MKSIVYLILAFLIGAPSAQAEQSSLSAVRDPGVSYEHYMYRVDRTPMGDVTPSAASPSSAAIPYREADLPDVTIWNSPVQLQELFERMRDERFLTSPQLPMNYRRSTWLYPDDGCFARAALAIANLARWQAPVPKKVYVFGNLLASTPNTRSGQVSWWYHVAPIVSVRDQKFVLDPAINPHRPLTLREWLGTMATDVSALRVSICSSASYGPRGLCEPRTNETEQLGLRDQRGFLESERLRITSLGRNPDQELGNQPPWRVRAVR